MRFHVLTLFPQMILDGLNTSITGRAIQNGILSVDAVNIRDFAENKYMKVDDYPYGGGAGLVMQPGPVCSAYKSVTERIGKKPRGGVYDTAGVSVYTADGTGICTGRRFVYSVRAL